MDNKTLRKTFGVIALSLALLFAYMAHLLEQLIPSTIVILGLGFGMGVLTITGAALFVLPSIDEQEN